MNLFRKHHFQWLSLAVISMTALFNISCSDDGEPSGSDANDILSFTIEGFETNVSTSGRYVVITAPEGADVTQLAPVITVSPGASISPASGDVQDFSKPVTYTVTSENKTEAEYTVSVNHIEGLKEVSLKLLNMIYSGTIDRARKEVVVGVPFGTVRRWLQIGEKVTLDATVASGYTVSPATGTEVDIDNPPTLTLTTPGSKTVEYTLVIKGTENDIEWISFDTPLGVTVHGFRAYQAYTQFTSGLAETDQVFFVLTNDNLSALPVSITVSEGATVDPASGTPRNFNEEQVYTVTSETGVAKTYRVRFIKRDAVLLNEGDRISGMSISTSGASFQTTYRAVSEITGAVLVNQETAAEVSTTVYTNIFENLQYLTVDPTTSVPAGNYNLRLTLANGTKILSTCRFTAQ